VNAAFARHLDEDVDAMLAPFDGDSVVRIADVNLDQIAALMFFDADAAFADLVALGDDLGFNGVLVPGSDLDVGVGGFDAQFGLAGELVGFRPFVGVGAL
jgi:hypothetical protein